MTQGPNKGLPLKRRKEGKTDYRQRLKLLKSGKPRLVVRKSNKHVWAQLIEARNEGDHTLVSAHSSELRGYGWDMPTGNIPSAYLVGKLIGSRSVDNSYEEAVLDLGLNPATKGNKLFAVLKGAVDSGMDIPYSEDIIPSWERISGEHIADYGPYEGAENMPDTFEKVLDNIDEK